MACRFRFTLGRQFPIRVTHDNGLWSNIDQASFEQILLNLCINARDAMPAGGELVIEVHSALIDEAFCLAHHEARVGEFVRVSVSDSGEGMSEQVMERMFEPLYTTKGPDQGSGLGLSMVYGLMQQHLGFIHVTSNVGEGTTVDLYFPAAKGDGIQGAVEDEERRGTILLVEDDPGVRSMSREGLEISGYTVISASEGLEALRLLANHAGQVDLVLLDIVMPLMGGAEVYRKMKATKPDIKFLFHSAQPPDTATREIIKNERFLLKPYNLNLLSEIVNDMFGNNREE